MTKKYLKIGILIISYGLLVIGFSSSALAETAPEFMITWRAKNYIPSDYLGRVLPIDKTPIEVSFEIIDDSKIADLSKTEVFWHINGEFKKSGFGIKNLSFVADRIFGSQLIEIIIPNYQPKGKEAISLEKKLIVPLFAPEAVIDSPYPNNEIKPGLNDFRALLYFINSMDPVSDVFYSWSTNGQKTEGTVENPSLLTLDTTNLLTGAEFNLTLNVRNFLKNTEFADQLITLKVK